MPEYINCKFTFKNKLFITRKFSFGSYYHRVEFGHGGICICHISFRVLDFAAVE